MLKDEEADKIQSIRRHQHSDEVRQQIREKEKDRIHARNAFFEEGIKLDQEAKARWVLPCLVPMRRLPRPPRSKRIDCAE